MVRQGAPTRTIKRKATIPPLKDEGIIPRLEQPFKENSSPIPIEDGKAKGGGEVTRRELASHLANDAPRDTKSQGQSWSESYVNPSRLWRGFISARSYRSSAARRFEGEGCLSLISRWALCYLVRVLPWGFGEGRL